MSYNQPPNERAAFGPDGYAPVFFGEHENEKNMFVDIARAAGTAPTVLRGDQMSAEHAVFLEANHILTGDPVWAAGLMEAPVIGDLPVISQPVAQLPAQARQGGNHYPAAGQPAQSWGGMQSYSAGYDDGYRAGTVAAQAAYGHYPGAAQSTHDHFPGGGQAAYGYGNPAVTNPMPYGTSNFAFQGPGNNLWTTRPAPGTPGAPMMPHSGPAATPQMLRRSHSPSKQQNLAYRRRSPTDLNPMAPSFAPPFFAGPPAHLSYPPLANDPSYHTAANHNFAANNGIPARNAAWGFSGGVPAAIPYQVRRQEARVLVGQQRRFSPGSDDVRNHISSESSGASNDEDEHESNDAHAEPDEVFQEDEAEDEDDVDGEHESQEEASEEETSTATTPYKKRGKFHAGNKRLVCDECHRKHKNCIKPDPNKPCVGCMKARGGPIECKVTRKV